MLGVDLAERLLALSRAKAKDHGLRNVEFRAGDMLDLALPAQAFDAAVCVFGIFFVPDMPRQVAELWRMLRPGGQLAITTWGHDFCAPAYELWLNALRTIRPDLHSAFRPWDRITTP